MADPDPRFLVVERMVMECIIEYGYINTFSRSAIRTLLDPGLNYPFGNAKISYVRVREALDAIFTHLVFGGKVVTANDIRRAMSEADCHYLWFCD